MADFAAFCFLGLAVVLLIYYSSASVPLADVERLCGPKGVAQIHEPLFSVLDLDKGVVVCRDGTLRNIK